MSAHSDMQYFGPLAVSSSRANQEGSNIHESLGPRHLHTLETSPFCFSHKGMKSIHPLFLRYLGAALITVIPIAPIRLN